jgi:ATP-dependent helicase HrpA
MIEPLKIDFPESLPVSARREEIMAAMGAPGDHRLRRNRLWQDHPTAQNCAGDGPWLVQLPQNHARWSPGTTWQTHRPHPARRIAASSVANALPKSYIPALGEVVGFKVRFQDRLSRDASVKLMTDGILLAETQTDPLLNAYDTIIIDEAHERSLNIDFLLGYLKQILPRRPDLKVVVTCHD